MKKGLAVLMSIIMAMAFTATTTLYPEQVFAAETGESCLSDNDIENNNQDCSDENNDETSTDTPSEFPVIIDKLPRYIVDVPIEDEPAVSGAVNSEQPKSKKTRTRKGTARSAAGGQNRVTTYRAGQPENLHAATAALFAATAVTATVLRLSFIWQKNN